MLNSTYLNEINLGFVTLQTWGFLVSVGFITALIISLKEAKKKNIDSDVIWNVMIIALFGMILGGKIFDFIFNGNIELDFNYGFSSTKGALFSLILVFAYLKVKKYDYKKIFDCLIIGFVTSLIIVRVGCFLISDHIGKITNLPWGMVYIDGTIRHPVALYHIIFLSIILILIIYIRKKYKKSGLTLYLFFFLYSLFRFFVDFSRCDDLAICDRHFSGLTFTQWILIFVFIFSFYKIFFKYKLFSGFLCDRIKVINK